MIEIFVLIAFAKKLAEMAQERGRSRWWAAAGVAGWVLG